MEMARNLDIDLRESSLGTITPLVEKAISSFRKPDQTNLVREYTKPFEKKVEGFLEKIVRCEFPREAKPENLDILTGEFFSHHYRALRIYIMPMMTWDYSGNNMNKTEELVGEIADILAMGVDVMFRKYDAMLSQNEDKKQINKELMGTSHEIRKILDEIFPREEDLSRDSKVLNSLKKLSDSARRDSVRFALASYRLKQEVGSRGLDNTKEIEKAIEDLIERYNLGMDVPAFISGIKNTNNRNILLSTRLKEILNQIEGAYIAREASGKTETQEDYRGELRKSFGISVNSAFDRKFEADSGQAGILKGARDKFLEITAGEKYLRHVLVKREIIPAMEELQAEFVSHVQANRITSGVKKKMQGRFGRIYDVLDSEINGENPEQLLDVLIIGKRKISEKTTGIKKGIADFVNPISKPLGYSLRYRRIEPEIWSLTHEDKSARERYSDIISTESFSDSYRFPPVQKSKPRIQEVVRETPISKSSKVSKSKISEQLNIFPSAEIPKQKTELPKTDLQDNPPQKTDGISAIHYERPKEEVLEFARPLSYSSDVREAELSLNRIKLQRKFGFVEPSQADKETIRVLGIYGSSTYHKAERRYAERQSSIAA